MKERTPVIKQAKLAERLREPKSRLATRLFTEAVMNAKLPRATSRAARTP
jgi:hypothetical protein